MSRDDHDRSSPTPESSPPSPESNPIVQAANAAADAANAAATAANAAAEAAQVVIDATEAMPARAEEVMASPLPPATVSDAVAEEIGPEAVERIHDEVDAYEKKLRRQYRRAEDRRLMSRKRASFLETLIKHEMADEERDEADLRQEEHVVISWNLILSLAFLVIFGIGAILVKDRFEALAKSFTELCVGNFSWFYVLVSALSVFYLVYLAFSRFGPVVLGDPEDEPEFSDLSWYAMLFSAGIGVGLMFYGSAEPVHHYLHPPVGAAKTVSAARWALIYSAFHWGFNAWAIYTLCAVGVAYYGFRKRKKYLLSSSIVDLSSNPWIRKPLKIMTDLCATLAVVFGVASSIGLGVMQIAGAMKYSFGVDAANTMGYATILGIITVLFLLSASTGLERGIKWLSNLNMGVAIALMLFIFATGPSLFQIKVFVDSIGGYLNEFFNLSFKIAPFAPAYEKWMGKWTLSYFTWWIAWAPFVGIFIARISKGRTIREVISGCLLVPTIFSILWFSVLGGAALHLEIHDPAHGIGALVDSDITVAFFALLRQYPLSTLTSITAIFLLFTFLITSADSACFTVAMMTTEGDLEPGTGMKLLWGVIISVLTLVLITGGGIQAMQAAVLIFALPFSVVLVLIALSLLVRLNTQVRRERI